MYKQIAGALRSEIISGAFGDGRRLPTEDQLVKQFEASKNTVRLALGVLINEGLITSTPGRGTYVRERVSFTYTAFAPSRDTGSESDTYVTQALEQGRKPSQSLDVGVVSATTSVATKLGVDEGDAVARRRELQSADGRPWIGLDSYYPMDLASECGLLTPDNIPEGAIRRLAQHGYSEIVYRDEISSRMPSPEEVELFEIQSGVPLIIHSRTASSESRPLRLSVFAFPADRNRIVYELIVTLQPPPA